MTRLRLDIRAAAAGAPAAVLVSAVLFALSSASGAAIGSGTAIEAGTTVGAGTSIAAATNEAPAPPPAGVPACSIEPDVLDVAVPAGALAVRLELPSPPGSAIAPDALAGAIAAGVHVASVHGVPLPAPSSHREGIGERVAARSIEDRADPGSRRMTPNGVPEMVVRFDRPADGQPVTREDGDAGDIVSMLMDVPDGRRVEICIAGVSGGSAFTCCDTIVVSNRGLRDLPRGLAPSAIP